MDQANAAQPPVRRNRRNQQPADAQAQPAGNQARRGRGRRNGRRGQQPQGQAQAPAAPAAPAQAAVPAAVPPVVPAPVQAAPPGVPGQPAAPAAAAPTMTIEEAMVEWCRAYTVRIPKSLLSVFKELNIPYQIVPNGPAGENPHALLAAYRTLATVYTLSELVKRGHRTIDLWYGAFRDESIVRFMNSFLEKVGFGADYITVHQIHGHIVPHDLYRRPDAPHGQRVVATAAFFLDVYCHGTAGSAIEIDPTWMASLDYNEVAWVGHPFYGYYGAAATAAWIRTDDTVYWSPDVVNDVYPPHPPGDGMHSSGGNGVKAWKIAHTWHYEGAVVYNLVSFQRSEVVSKPRLCHVVRNQKMKTRVPDYAALLTSWWSRAVMGPILSMGVLDRFLPSREVVVNLRHVQEARAYLSSRSLNSYTFQSLITQVRRSCTGDPEWAVVNERFPAFFDNYAEEVALAAMVSDAQSRSYRYSYVRNNFAQHFSSANDSLRHIDQPLASGIFTWRRTVIAAVVLTLVSLKKRRPRHVRYLASSMAALCSGVEMRSSLRQIAETTVEICKEPSGSLATYVKEKGKRLLQNVCSLGMKFCVNLWGALFNTVAVNPESMESMDSFFGKIVLGASLHGQAQFGIDAGHMSFEQCSLYAFSTCAFVPLLEEIIKRIFKHPVWKIGACIYLTNGDLVELSMAPIDNFLQFAFHLMMAFLPFKFAVPIHMFHNAWISWDVGDQVIQSARGLGPDLPEPYRPLAANPIKNLMLLALFAMLVAAFQRMRIAHQNRPTSNHQLELIDEAAKDRSPTESFRHIRQLRDLSTFPVTQSEFPRLNIADYPKPEFSDSVVVVDNLPDDDNLAQPSERQFFRWFAHSVPLFVPAKTVNNLRKMVDFRLRRAVEPYALEQWIAATVFMHYAVGSCLYVNCTPQFVNFHVGGPFTSHNSPHCLMRNAPAAPGPLVKSDPGDLPPIPATDRLVLDWVKILDHSAMGLIDIYGQWVSWKTECYPRIQISHEMWQTWRRHCDPAKLKRYDSAWAKVSHSRPTALSRAIKSIQVNQKEDEALIKIPDAEGETWLEKGAISRSIHAVDPEIAVTIGPYVYEATERFKKDFWLKKVGAVQNSPIFVTMGAGRVDNELNEWWDFATTTLGWHLIVAGDDMLLIYNTGAHVCTKHNCAGLYFVEGDLSQCDHSSRLGTMQNEMVFLSHYGVPHEILELMLANSRADLIVGLRNRPGDTMLIHRGYERNTGGTDTTIGNSLTSITAALYTLMANTQNFESPTSGIAFTSCGCDNWITKTTDQQVELFRYQYSCLGLTLKVRVTSCNEASEVGLVCRLPTFLKGAWLPTTGDAPSDRCWSPLPSRLLKMGKTLSDPRLTMRKSSKEVVTLTTALERYAAAITYSMRAYAWPQPIVNWLKRVQPPVTDLFVTSHEFQERFRVALKNDMFVLSTLAESSFVPVPKIDDVALEMYAKYYGVELEDLLDFFRQLQDLKPFTFFAHPIWYALASDYA